MRIGYFRVHLSLSVQTREGGCQGDVSIGTTYMDR